jgi:hypothetical protein
MLLKEEYDVSNTADDALAAYRAGGHHHYGYPHAAQDGHGSSSKFARSTMISSSSS